MLLIGIAGKKHTGKTTTGIILQEEYKFALASFMDPLREFTCQLFGLTHAQLEQRKETTDPFLGITPRDFMQLIGTDVIRNQINEHAWIHAAEARIDHQLRHNPKKPLAFTDIRTEDEAQFIRLRGGYIIHMHRRTDSTDGHITEKGIQTQPGDFGIANNTNSTAPIKAQIEEILTTRLHREDRLTTMRATLGKPHAHPQ